MRFHIGSIDLFTLLMMTAKSMLSKRSVLRINEDMVVTELIISEVSLFCFKKAREFIAGLPPSKFLRVQEDRHC